MHTLSRNEHKTTVSNVFSKIVSHSISITRCCVYCLCQWLETVCAMYRKKWIQDSDGELKPFSIDVPVSEWERYFVRYPSKPTNELKAQQQQHTQKYTKHWIERVVVIFFSRVDFDSFRMLWIERVLRTSSAACVSYAYTRLCVPLNLYTHQWVGWITGDDRENTRCVCSFFLLFGVLFRFVSFASLAMLSCEYLVVGFSSSRMSCFRKFFSPLDWNLCMSIKIATLELQTIIDAHSTTHNFFLFLLIYSNSVSIQNKMLTRNWLKHDTIHWAEHCG